MLMERGKGIVSRHPDVLNGDLVFAGTRVPVKNGFPGVSREQAVAYLEISHKAVEEAVSASTPR